MTNAEEQEAALRGTSALFAEVGACGSGVYENDVKPVETCTTRHRQTQNPPKCTHSKSVPAFSLTVVLPSSDGGDLRPGGGETAAPL